MAPGEVALLKAKISTLGVQLSELQQRYRHTQVMEPPSSMTHSGSALSETHSRSASMPRLSPQPQLVQSLGLSDGHTSSLSNIDTIAERIPKGIKCLPAFDDKTEDFQTWKLWLEAVADVYKWTDNQKRCAVLSTLRGEPARFAFKALFPEVQNDYKALIKELSAQFAEFESKKVYRAKYRNLKQEVGQSEQELAATIKMIYGRAFPGRDRKISQEDMVSKFLEALLDGGQRMALEYPKVPETLDAALRQAIHYHEAARKTNDINDGFMRAYSTQSADMETDNPGYSQLQEIVQAVGHTMSQSKPQDGTQKQISTHSMATEPTATVSGTKEGNEKGSEPKFSLTDVNNCLAMPWAIISLRGMKGMEIHPRPQNPETRTMPKEVRMQSSVGTALS